MTKQEVIFGLKCHAGENGCAKCPYDDMFAIHGLTCVQHLIIDAIDLLEEQEKEVEPIKTTEKQKERANMIDLFIPDFWCGECHFNLIGHPKFCPNCGKKVKWDAQA